MAEAEEKIEPTKKVETVRKVVEAVPSQPFIPPRRIPPENATAAPKEETSSPSAPPLPEEKVEKALYSPKLEKAPPKLKSMLAQEGAKDRAMEVARAKAAAEAAAAVADLARPKRALKRKQVWDPSESATNPQHGSAPLRETPPQEEPLTLLRRGGRRGASGSEAGESGEEEGPTSSWGKRSKRVGGGGGSDSGGNMERSNLSATARLRSPVTVDLLPPPPASLAPDIGALLRLREATDAAAALYGEKHEAHARVCKHAHTLREAADIAVAAADAAEAKVRGWLQRVTKGVPGCVVGLGSMPASPRPPGVVNKRYKSVTKVL
jgi:hypothetical protein